MITNSTKGCYRLSKTALEKEAIEKIPLSKSVNLSKWLGSQLFLLTKVHNASRRRVKRGQVYWCQFGENIGSEQCSTRPALILQNDKANRSSPNTVVAPITNTADSNSSVYKLERPEDSQIQGYVLLGNIVTVSKVRLKDYICDLDEKTEMPGIEEAMYNALGVMGKLKHQRQKLANIEDHLNRAKRERNEAQDTLAEIRGILHLAQGVEYAKILEEVRKLKEQIKENK